MLLRDKAPAAQCNFAIRQELILHYSDTVRKYAKRYENEFVPYDDLVSVGMIALIDEIDGFGHYKNAHISTYISNNVDRAIRSYAENETEKYLQIEDIDVYYIDTAYNDSYLYEIVSDHMLTKTLRELLQTLTPREAEVISLRFGMYGNKPMTLEEIGKEFGVTRGRIRQIEAKALRELRHPSKSKIIKDYLY